MSVRFQPNWGTMIARAFYLKQREGRHGTIASPMKNVEPKTTRHIDWLHLLPRRQAWLKTLLVLPFGLSLANFLGSSYNFASTAIATERQYPIAIAVMFFSVAMTILLLSLCAHWGYYIWKQEQRTWYPHHRGWWFGCYTTLTIALSFGIVSLTATHFNLCDEGSWLGFGQSLVCNLDKNYGFEPKSWFGIWFIIAAYCYQLEAKIHEVFGKKSPPASFQYPDTEYTTDRDGELEPPKAERDVASHR
jgi:hypothetical protein